MPTKLNGRMLVSDGANETANSQLLYFTCSSLSFDDERIYLISDRDGNPNVYMKNLLIGEWKQISDNQKGFSKAMFILMAQKVKDLAKRVFVSTISESVFITSRMIRL